MKKTLCIAVILLTFSCAKEIKKENLVKTIDFSSSLTVEEHINLSNIASSIEYIPLESSEQSWIVSISKICFTAKNIYVFDKSQKVLLQFNLSGKFKRKIGVQGKGPNEYNSIYNFAVLSLNKGSETIGITDSGTGKILLFDEQGDFKFGFKPEVFAVDLEFLNDGTIVTYMSENSSFENDSNSLSFYSQNGKILNTLKTNDVDYDGGTPLIGSLTKYKGAVYFYDPAARTVFEVISSKEANESIIIDLGNKALPLEELGNEGISEKAFGIQSVIESSGYLFTKFAYKRHRVAAFYSKKDKKAANVIFNYDLIDTGFHNDIDGGMPFWPIATTHDGKWVSLFTPLKAKRILNDSYYDSFTVQDVEARNKLLKLIQDSEESDNFIIQLTTPLNN